MSNDTNFGRIRPKNKTGNEPFHSDGESRLFVLKDFWGWYASDLVDNATRGCLAEFLVAKALDAVSSDSVREQWAAFDLRTPTGTKVEVKSAAYIQSWSQKTLSKIQFVIPKTRAWSPDTNELKKASLRQADVYVFALLAHQTKTEIDPLNVRQWRFYVLPTSELNARKRSQHSITLKSLESLTGSIEFEDLAKAVEVAARENANSISQPAGLSAATTN